MSKLLPLLILGLCLSSSFAQEEGSCDALKAELTQVKSQLAKKQDAQSKCSKSLASEKDHLKISRAKFNVASFELKQCTDELEQLKSKLQKAQELSLPVVAKALTQALKAKGLAVQGELMTIFEETKQGKFDRVRVLALNLLESLRGASSSVYAFIATEADEHLPPAVKEKLRSMKAAASTAWRVHLVEAAWAAPIVSRVQAVNEELKGIVTAQLHTVPSLQPYSDPAFVQLIVYALFGLPLLLSVVLPLALFLTTRKAEEAPHLCKNGSKGKGKSTRRT